METIQVSVRCLYVALTCSRFATYPARTPSHGHDPERESCGHDEQRCISVVGAPSLLVEPRLRLNEKALRIFVKLLGS